MNNPFNWRISLTEAGLQKGSLYNYNIPTPTTAMFTDHTTAVVRLDGSQSLHGFTQVTLLWELLTGIQAQTIRGFVDSAKGGSGLLFLTLDKGDASAPGRAWIDISGYPHRHSQLTQEGPIMGSKGQPHYLNVQLFVNAVTVINDPSNYSS